ncbi:internal scaffolding protein [robinz microvirus RP_105]|nr:internal scaffolding protein [robinz microvirus RP_105]
MGSYGEDDGKELWRAKRSGHYVQHEAAQFGEFNDEPSRTRQEFADECDINNIMQRYQATGIISHVDERQPMYMDVTDVPDLQRSLHIFEEANASFMSLPANVRREFDNDPHAFIVYAADPANVEQMRTWGLAEPLPKVPDAIRVEIATPPPSQSPTPGVAPSPDKAAPSA